MTDFGGESGGTITKLGASAMATDHAYMRTSKSVNQQDIRSTGDHANTRVVAAGTTKVHFRGMRHAYLMQRAVTRIAAL
jgi:hypothetical protein